MAADKVALAAARQALQADQSVVMDTVTVKAHSAGMGRSEGVNSGSSGGTTGSSGGKGGGAGGGHHGGRH